MIEPSHTFRRAGDTGHVRQCRSAQHDYFDAESPRGGNLAVGGGAAAIFRNHGVDAMLNEQHRIISFAERPARNDVSGLRHLQRRIDRVDTAYQIKMLRRLSKWRYFLSSDSEKDAARRLVQHLNGFFGICHFLPAVTDYSGPWRSPQGQQRYAGDLRRPCRIGRNYRRIGMRGIDQIISVFEAKIVRETADAAETAPAQRHQVLSWRERPAGKGERYGILRAPGHSFREPPRFQSAAEDEDALHAVC